MSALPKDAGNVVSGVSTYGFWEYIAWCDNVVYDLWMHLSTADGMSLGLGAGLIITSMLCRSVFIAPTLYGVSTEKSLSNIHCLAIVWYENEAHAT